MLTSSSASLNILIFAIPTVSFLITLFLVPFAKWIGEKYKLSDKPNKRKLHKTSIVRLGGVAIFIGFFAGLASILLFGNTENLSFENISLYGRILLIMSSAIFFLGLFDDVFKLSPAFRLTFQFLVASFAWSNNLRINSLDLSLISDNYANFQIPSFFSYLITIFWIVGIINAINWMDGADGLVTGLFIIASGSFLLIEYSNDVYYLSCILSSLIGAALAFLIFNYNPAKILMGDCGSYFLGFHLATVSFLSSTDSNVPLNVTSVLLIMFIPIADMIFVIFNRLINGKLPFYPDQTHLHHRLISSGLNQRQTVRIIWSLSLLLSSIALVIEGKINTIFIFYSLIIHCLCNVKIRKFIKTILC